LELNLERHVHYTKKEWLFHPHIDLLKHKQIKTFVDAGACTGEYSKILLYSIPTITKAILIEPIESNCNFIKNYLKDHRAELLQAALFETQSSVEIILDTTNVGGNSVFEDFVKGEKVSKVTVPCISIKDILDKVDIDFLKMDIEGSEWDIIDNSKELQNIPYLMIEVHGKDVFEALEYIKEKLPSHTIVPYKHLFCKKRLFNKR